MYEYRIGLIAGSKSSINSWERVVSVEEFVSELLFVTQAFGGSEFKVDQTVDSFNQTFMIKTPGGSERYFIRTCTEEIDSSDDENEPDDGEDQAYELWAGK